jgi:PhnB protein
MEMFFIWFGSFYKTKLADGVVAINPSYCRFYTPGPPPLGSSFASWIIIMTIMAQINAYLTFDGNCREAMTFYRDCFGGELNMQTVAGSPMEDQFHPEARRMILHAHLANKTLTLQGSDMNGREKLVRGNTILLSLQCTSENEIRTFFRKLAKGGKVVHPLHEFFAGVMGTLTDRFEKDWILYCERKLQTEFNK